MYQRIAAALVLLPIAISAVWAGGVWFSLLLAVAAWLMAREWVPLAIGRTNRGQVVILAMAGMVAAFMPFWAPLGVVLAALAVCWAVSILLVARWGAERPVWASFGVVYIAAPVLTLNLLRTDDLYGMAAVLWLFLVVWSTDTGAFIVGRLVGGPRLAPRLSPSKTWSGLGGGILCASGMSALVSWFIGVPDIMLPSVIAGCLAIVAQSGDILESGLKRAAGVKDSSALIPGHGGVLDRVDGIVTASVAAFLVGTWRGGAETGVGLLVW